MWLWKEPADTPNKNSYMCTSVYSFGKIVVNLWFASYVAYILYK